MLECSVFGSDSAILLYYEISDKQAESTDQYVYIEMRGLMMYHLDVRGC